MKKLLYFKHSITLRNNKGVGDLLATHGLKMYAQYIILLEFSAERYLQEGETNITATTNQLATLFKCKQNKVDTLLGHLQLLGLTSCERMNNQRIISCVNLLDLLPKKSETGHKRREDKIKEEKRREDNENSGELFENSSSKIPFKKNHTIKTHPVKLPDDCDEGYLENFSIQFINNHWNEAKTFWLGTNKKKDFDVFMFDSLKRTAAKFEDVHFEFEIAKNELFAEARENQKKSLASKKEV